MRLAALCHHLQQQCIAYCGLPALCHIFKTSSSAPAHRVLPHFLRHASRWPRLQAPATVFAMIRLLISFLASASLLSVALTAQAQSRTQQSAGSPQAEQPTPPATPAARPGDVDTPEHLVAALYDVISGPAGKRDWNRFLSLFYPGARLMPSGKNPQGALTVRMLRPQEYVARAQAIFDKEGFFERSIANRMEVWDRIAHVWSTYESRHAKDDAAPFARGINSIQLFHDGKRWWLVSVYWEAEDATHHLPEPYLH